MSKIEITCPTVEVVVGDETFTIKPFGVGQLPTVALHLAAIAEKWFAGMTLPILLAKGGEDVLQVMAIAIGKPRAWFDSLYDLDKAVEILSAVIQLNQETITKKLVPAVQAILPTLLPATQVPAEA